ncbi:MAG: enoyl-CoA hydratase/isomerase family protein [Myxococcota bacterium]
MAAEILYEKKGRIATVTINRPERRNSLNMPAMRRLALAWTDIRDDPDVWVAILTGAGERDFCVGADLKEFIPQVTNQIEELASFETSILGPDFDARAPLVAVLREGDLFKPVIAAVNGVCAAGGMEMLQGTDIRIAAENATFAVAEVKRGLFPGGGSTVRLPNQIPYAWAMEILLTGDPISARTALDLGLLNRVVAPSELMNEAHAMAERILENGPLAVRAVKESVIRGSGLPLAKAMEFELEQAARVFSSDDAVEGPRAFLEKRKPNWQGR